MQGSARSKVDRVYDAVYEDEDARVCRDISDDACREVPENFFLTLAALAMTKLGDALINPKTTLTWLLSSLGAAANEVSTTAAIGVFAGMALIAIGFCYRLPEVQ